MGKRVVIVGGVAAGMKTAAASVSRQMEQLKSARLSHFTTTTHSDMVTTFIMQTVLPLRLPMSGRTGFWTTATT